MTLVVSINGADNIGKTTQIKLLPVHHDLKLVGSLHDTDKTMADLVSSKKIRSWWWDCSNEDFVRTVFEAVSSRHHNALKGSPVLSILDRGSVMFEAVAVAVIATKDPSYNIESARSRLTELLQQNATQPPRDSAILLKYGNDINVAVEHCLNSEREPVDDRYRSYQQLLHQELARQEECGCYFPVIQADRPYRLVQDDIRSFIKAKSSPPIASIFVPVLHQVRAVYVFGGLSESGKSTLAQRVCLREVSGTACRMKIAYLCEKASARISESVYNCCERDQAVGIVQELDSYARSHQWLRVITLESAHRATSTKWLQLFLDTKIRVVYVDANEGVRLARSLVSKEEFVANDKAKRERGAQKIKDFADIVLDNNGEFQKTLEKLEDILS